MNAREKPKPALTGSAYGRSSTAYIASEPALRAALLQEAPEAMLSGDVEIGKTVLRDCIKATNGSREQAGRVARHDPDSMI